MVAQSDWLPMMIATGLAAIGAFAFWLGANGPEKEAGDYMNRPCGGKPIRVGYAGLRGDSGVEVKPREGALMAKRSLPRPAIGTGRARPARELPRRDAAVERSNDDAARAPSGPRASDPRRLAAEV